MKHLKNKTSKTKKPWPTKEAMEQVYKMNLWGENDSGFYSGIGSHNPEIVNPYVNAVKLFFTSFESPPVVCDLGCGDFNVGRQLVAATKKYVAVDIVKDLIHRNKEKFKVENLEFQCLDIAVDSLPAGDCAILRQVLQHLSNEEIQNILRKLVHYKYVLLTEHIPVGTFEPNKDIISGQGIRLKKQSGLNLLAPPFNFKVKEKRELLSFALNDGNGKIVTTMYKIL